MKNRSKWESQAKWEIKHVAKVFLILKHHTAECYRKSMVQLPWPQDSYNHLSLATMLVSVCASIRNASPTKPGVGQPLLRVAYHLVGKWLSKLTCGHPGTILYSKDLWSKHQDTKEWISSVVVSPREIILSLKALAYVIGSTLAGTYSTLHCLWDLSSQCPYLPHKVTHGTDSPINSLLIWGQGLLSLSLSLLYCLG